MYNQFWLLTGGIVQCAIPSWKDCWPRDIFEKFFGSSNHCPQEKHKIVMEENVGQECENLERMVRRPSPYCTMQPW